MTKKKHNTKTQQQKHHPDSSPYTSHTHKTICALEMFRSGFKHGIFVFFTFSDNKVGMKKSRGHSEWSHDSGGAATPRGRQVIYHLSSNSVASGERTQLLSTETNKTFFLVYSTGKLLLGNSAHIPPSYTMLFK